MISSWTGSPAGNRKPAGSAAQATAMHKTDVESLQRREYFRSTQVCVTESTNRRVKFLLEQHRHRGARGQQVNHLGERVESDIKQLTRNGRRALNRWPKPSAAGGGGNSEETK